MRFVNTGIAAQDDHKPTFGHESDRKRDKVFRGNPRSLGLFLHILEMFSRGSANAYDEIVGKK